MRALSLVVPFALASFTLLACSEESIDPRGGSSPVGGGGSGGRGSEGGQGGEGAAYTGPCTPLSLGDTVVFFGSFARTGLEAPVAPVLPELAKTRLTLELYEDDGSGTLPPLAPGSFAFATPPDDNYGTCQHCLLLVGYDLGGQPQRAFYAKNGTMVVDKLDADDTTIVAGSVDKVELSEVAQNPDLSWEEKPGGACFYVERWAFDTTPVNGASCESAEECPNEAQQICSPKTARCAAPQCDLTFDSLFCADGEVCLSQLSAPEDEVVGPAIGACYEVCDPANLASCGDGRLCRPLGPTQTLGVCLKQGVTSQEEACTPRDISTVCAGEAICSGEPGVCAPICSFLEPISGCAVDSGTFCSLANLCEPASHGDAAAVGEACDGASPALVECGVEGDAFRGLCMNFFPGDPDLVCERLCRTGAPACPGAEACLGVFGNPEVGICRVPAVCGDGALGVIGGEICDDGNTVGGDGCASDCLSAELDALCAAATPLTIGATFQGDTQGGPSGYPSSCDPFIATPVRTFSYQPPGPGKLVLSIASAADLGLSVLADCADGGSELACQNLVAPSEDLVVQIPSTPTQPLLIVARGSYPLAVGPFTLSAAFSPAVCGDGELQGAEACDDGNTSSGDGCAGDCAAVEWTLVCQTLPPLQLGTPNVGDTSNGTAFFDLSGICSSVAGGGPERAYGFTAPSDGTLTLTLTQPSDDFALFIEDGCGPADQQAFVGCSNFAPIGDDEHTDVFLGGGQSVTVIVDGFTSASAGAYELSATFAPQ